MKTREIVLWALVTGACIAVLVVGFEVGHLKRRTQALERWVAVQSALTNHLTAPWIWSTNDLPHTNWVRSGTSYMTIEELDREVWKFTNRPGAVLGVQWVVTNEAVSRALLLRDVR